MALDSVPTSLDELPQHLNAKVVDFIRHARNNNYRVGLAEQADALRIAEYCDIRDKYAFKLGLKSLVCSDEEDWKKFDEMFDAYWMASNVKQFVQSSQTPAAKKKAPEQSKQQAEGGNRQTPKPSSADTNAQAEHDEVPEASGTKEGASSRANLAKEDFHSIKDPDEMRKMERLIERLAKQMKKRISRRYQYQSNKGIIDLRKTMRKSLRYGGTPLELCRKRLKPETPKLIIIVDVSRSMAMYSFLFLRFARGLISVFKDVQAFAYHTHLLPITDALKQTDLMRVRNSLAMMSEGWSGGTKIGESLQKFNQRYGQSVNKRSMVMIISDGLDSGSSDELKQQMQKLKRKSRKIIWLNPLLGQEGYEPVAAGMSAALPYVDLFAPANNLASLAALESALTKTW
jgi:uncharacterized protein with von Willebrand factor type A (vWA) domain